MITPERKRPWKPGPVGSCSPAGSIIGITCCAAGEPEAGPILVDGYGVVVGGVVKMLSPIVVSPVVRCGDGSGFVECRELGDQGAVVSLTIGAPACWRRDSSLGRSEVESEPVRPNVGRLSAHDRHAMREVRHMGAPVSPTRSALASEGMPPCCSRLSGLDGLDLTSSPA